MKLQEDNVFTRVCLSTPHPPPGTIFIQLLNKDTILPQCLLQLSRNKEENADAF